MAPEADTPRDPAALVSTLAALGAGVLMAFQSRMNGSLARTLGAPVEASLWSFGSGLVLLALLMLLPAHRRGLRTARDAVRRGELRWWMLLAGVFGGALVAAQAAVVPVIGVAMFSVAVIGGQTVGGLLVDGLGLGPGERQRLSWARALAAGLALVGVVLAASAGGGLSGVVWPVALGVVVGFGTTIQTGWNGRITRATGQPLVGTAINFLTGTAALAGYAVALLAAGRFRPVPLRGQWWMWWGGLCGIVFVAVASVAVRHIGVLLFTLLTLVTQLLTALVLDVLTPGLTGVVSPQRLVGVAVTALAAAGAGYAAARSARAGRRT